MEISGGVALGKNHDVIVHGVPELFMEQGKQKVWVVRYHPVNLLRRVKI